MTDPYIWTHLIAAVVAIPLIILLLIRRKGDARHKQLGRVAAGLLAIIAISSFWITESNGDRWSAIHILSVVTLINIPYAIYSIRRGKVRAHKMAMMGVAAGFLIAGAFTLMPGRFLGSLLFG